MIELPEAIVLSNQITHTLGGKHIARVVAAPRFQRKVSHYTRLVNLTPYPYTDEMIVLFTR